VKSGFQCSFTRGEFSVRPMKLRKIAREIFLEAVRAADPHEGVKKAVRYEGGAVIIDGERYPLDDFPRIVVVGMGKASARMGEALEEILGDAIDDGWINTKYGHASPLSRIHVHECGHPVPDENGVEGSNRIIGLLETADEHTLVIGLISGGGSALAPAPAEGITLGEKQEVTRILLRAGATIKELNAVRKHLSVLKGGGMARLAYPARLHVLILSDVIGDRLDTIASGPATADESTFRDCIGIFRKYGVWESLPENVRSRFEAGVEGKTAETAKAYETFFSSVKTTLIGNNRQSVEAARKRAGDAGFETLVLTTVLEGEASEAGKFFAAVASEIARTGDPIPPPACVIAGGETTVTVTGDGKGGRNQEMALSAAVMLEGMNDVAFLSGGTDGTDGPTDAAGGVVDGGTVAAGERRNLDPHDYLARNDSYHYLKSVDGLLVTGPTGTNVMDIQILLVGKPARGRL